MKIVIFHENPEFIRNSSVLEFKESNPPNQTNEPTKKESNRKKKNRIKMSRKFPFMKSIEDVSKIDNLNGSHSTSLNQYKVSKTDFSAMVRFDKVVYDHGKYAILGNHPKILRFRSLAWSIRSLSWSISLKVCDHYRVRSSAMIVYFQWNIVSLNGSLESSIGSVQRSFTFCSMIVYCRSKDYLFSQDRKVGCAFLMVSSLYSPMQNSGQMIIRKTHPTLLKIWSDPTWIIPDFNSMIFHEITCFSWFF